MGCSRAVIFDFQNETSCSPGSTLTNPCDQSREIRKTYVHRYCTGRPAFGPEVGLWEVISTSRLTFESVLQRVGTSARA